MLPGGRFSTTFYLPVLLRGVFSAYMVTGREQALASGELLFLNIPAGLMDSTLPQHLEELGRNCRMLW